MVKLCDATLSEVAEKVAIPTYDRSQLRVGIAHFGVGNFHRTHQAAFIDRILHVEGNERWGIVGIGLSAGVESEKKATNFRQQDCLYTLTEFDSDGSAQSRVIGAMMGYLHAPSDPEGVLDLLSDPELRIVTLTITEGGYEVDERTGKFRVDRPHIQADLNSELPKNVFGYIVRALARRRAAGIAPFTVVSCDNLRQNGNTVRKAILGYATAWDSELTEWIDENLSCPNSMVDRIAPYVADEDRARLNEMTGVDDVIPVMSESYLQWVMEDNFPAGRPKLESVGVELRSDVETYETVKVRMLNATHILMSYPALLLGYRYVHDAMRDPRIVDLLETFLDVDVIPHLHGPEGVSLDEYKDLILNRFSNPAIGDQLIRIATDGASKIPVFHAKTIANQIETGMDVRRGALLFACYAHYLGGFDDGGARIDVTEPTLDPTDRTLADDRGSSGLLTIPTFAGLGLADSPEFVAEYLQFREQIASEGVASALESAIVVRERR
jgi:mannitol 2-dehydrogenase/sorbose reductase